jgi:hypothetical protein
MKWFKHDSDANLDDKLQHLMLDYGLEGYGLYWYCLELIANKFDVNNINFDLKHDARIIARNTGSTEERVSKMMLKMVELGLFEDSEGMITCLKLGNRLETSQTSNPVMRRVIQQIKDKSCHSHDPVMKDKIRLNKIRPDKIKVDKKRKDQQVDDGFNLFWNAYPKKVGKGKAIESWQKHQPDLDTVLKTLQWQIYSDQWVKENGAFIPNPATYINQQRWEDEKQLTRIERLANAI